MEIKKLKCLRCGHGTGKQKWISRLYDGRKPLYCPVCKSPLWDTPRIEKEK